ncbi:hypothetical protein IE53DRAFT_322754 [Violaceomyces palustris]|uniref:Uncharacterized protein n=1 Tax=Violaceomyces palustris TaxID=1673888 RepID=A0ACD0NLA1_9BASI|nr:hypothetical protein IE53DRAFT_322754 [Violaceomyces palustris]
MASFMRMITNPSVRTRRLATSSFFLATFFASIVTVSLSASTILPCPANRGGGSRGALAEKDQSRLDLRPNMPARGVGQRVLLTSKGGWIEIEEKPRRA